MDNADQIVQPNPDYCTHYRYRTTGKGKLNTRNTQHHKKRQHLDKEKYKIRHTI